MSTTAVTVIAVVLIVGSWLFAWALCRMAAIADEDARRARLIRMREQANRKGGGWQKAVAPPDEDTRPAGLPPKAPRP